MSSNGEMGASPQDAQPRAETRPEVDAATAAGRGANATRRGQPSAQHAGDGSELPVADARATRTRGDGSGMPRGERRGRRKSPEERSAEITAAARELALSDGLTAVTLRSVAARAGVTPALVAHYRPNMDALVAETFTAIVSSELGEIAQVADFEAPARAGVGNADAVERGSDASAASTSGARAVVEIEADESATQRLGALVATLLDGSRDDVTLVWVEAWALGRRNEALAVAVREQMDAWQGVLRSLLEEGVVRGEFAVADPAAVAWQLLGMIDGLNAQALVRWGEGRSVLLTHALEGLLGLERGALAASRTNGA